MDQEISLTAAQQQELQVNFEEALRSRADWKELFCKHWMSAKSVLELILKVPALPPNVAPILRAIITVGDRVHSTICG